MLSFICQPVHFSYLPFSSFRTKTKKCFTDLFKKTVSLPVTSSRLTPLHLINQFSTSINDNSNVLTLVKNFKNELTALKKEALLAHLKSHQQLSHLENSLQKEAFLFDKIKKDFLSTKIKIIGEFILSEAKYTAYQLIECFISVSGLGELLDKKTPYYSTAKTVKNESKSKLATYKFLIGCPIVLFALLCALTQSAIAAGLITFLIVIAIVVLVIVYLRFLRPCPVICPGLDNLTLKSKDIPSSPLFERLDKLNEIQKAFMADESVLLVAHPGTGKSTLIKTLAHLITANKCKSFLAHSQLFSMSSNFFQAYPPDGLSLGETRETFSRHTKKAIFFVDEIEPLFNENNYTGKPVNNLFLFRDQFPFTICATTSEHYENVVKANQSFTRRFKVVHLDALSENEVLASLYEQLNAKAPELKIEKEVLSYLIQQSQQYNPHTSLIEASSSLLSLTIMKATRCCFERLENEIDHLKQKISLFQNELYHSTLPMSQSQIKRLKSLSADLKEKKISLKKKRLLFERIKKMEKISLKMRKDSIIEAHRLTTSQKNFSKKWIVLQFQQNVLNQWIESQRMALDLPCKISRELIDELMTPKATTSMPKRLKQTNLFQFFKKFI